MDMLNSWILSLVETFPIAPKLHVDCLIYPQDCTDHNNWKTENLGGEGRVYIALETQC